MSIKYKLTLFDFDGTIADTEEAIILSICLTLEKFKFPIPAINELQKIVRQGKKMEDTFVSINPDFSVLSESDMQEIVNSYRELYLEHSIDKAKIYRGIRNVLIDFQAHNIFIGVVSNKGQVSLERTLEYFDLIKYFDLVVGDQFGAPKKPDPQLYNEKVAPKFKNIPPNQTLMIGDNSGDIAFANNVGMDSCWVTYGHGSALQANLNPTYIVGDAESLKYLIKVATEDNNFSDKENVGTLELMNDNLQ